MREAIGLCFDFEWANKNIMYGAYTRAASYFENSDLKATGTPGPGELALLEPLRDKLPAEVFGPAWTPPVSDGSGQDRALLKRADALLREAGCTRTGGEMRLPGGEPLVIEILDDDPVFQPVTQPFIRNLGLVGIKASSRMVDPSQYQARLKDFDFDLSPRRYSGGVTPGGELRDLYGSRAAATTGSNNLAGIADPAVDTLLSAIADAQSRAALTAACRALDRVLRAGRYWVPMWYSGQHRLACGTSSAVLPPRRNTTSAPRRRGGSTPRRPAGSGGIDPMLSYILRRIGLMIPTLFGIMLITFAIVQFAPGGPVEQVLSKLQGQSEGSLSRVTGGSGDLGGGGARGGGGNASNTSSYRGAQGLSPEFIAKLEKQFGFDKPAPSVSP